MAQQTVAYDTVSDSAPAAITCGFCGGEKYGTIFYEIGAGGGLPADWFPLDVNSVTIGVADAAVTGDLLSFDLMCEPRAAEDDIPSQANFLLSVYAGQTVPVDINRLSGTDAWAGEVTIAHDVSTTLVLSPEEGGRGRYNIMLNTVDLGSIRVDPPNTYIRVVLTVPNGSNSSLCTGLGLPQPAGFPLRDGDGRIGPRRNFIYSNGGVGEGWLWNESNQITDPTGTFTTGINGDWLIRLNVTPQVVDSDPDAGAPPADAGEEIESDAAVSEPDCLDSADCDDGEVCREGECIATAEECSENDDCEGGQICRESECVSVICSSPADCEGGMTCVENRCRNFCSGSADCEGGEVCDRDLGYCVPADGDKDVATGASDSGCSCDLSSGSSASFPTLGGFIASALAGLLARRRRSNQPA